MLKKGVFAVVAVALLTFAAPAAHAERWNYLGQAHVDGVRDHDNIEIGRAAGRYRALQIRVVNAPIDFDRVVVHYGNGQFEVLSVRQKICAGASTRAIALAGDSRGYKHGTLVRQGPSSFGKAAGERFRVAVK